jgi:hypothetical protein
MNFDLDRLRRLAIARNRETEREVRTITITDDEALALIELIDSERTGEWESDAD